MSVILRYVLCNEEAAVVKETFFGYLRISDSTGKGLLDAFLEKATELQLELSDCRGQSYDNGANMKGKHSGVQARMLDINPKAVYVPCANHTLNLVVVDSANSSTEALTFFWSTYKVVCAVFFLCSALGNFEETCRAVHDVTI